MNRREFLATSAATGSSWVCGPILSSAAPPAPAQYTRANTDWLANSGFGIGVHWTARTVPRQGPALPFQKAVEAFKVEEFAQAVDYTGAKYVLFTTTHALHKLPAPHPVVDRILPGRTCSRDLIGELAARLAARKISLLLYYNHSCNKNNDPAWMDAIGYTKPDKDRFVANLLEIVSWMGDHYGEKVKAWWFDSGYSLDASGPVKTAATRMNGVPFPWERMTVAAKTGFADRLVTYNSGLDETFLFTTHQDYWAGETRDLKHPATSRYLDNGMQWFGWVPLDTKYWLHGKPDSEIPPPRYPDEEIVRYVRECNRHDAPMTFNVGIYQDGTMAPASVEQLHRLGLALK